MRLRSGNLECEMNSEEGELTIQRSKVLSLGVKSNQVSSSRGRMFRANVSVLMCSQSWPANSIVKDLALTFAGSRNSQRIDLGDLERVDGVGLIVAGCG